MDLNKLLERVKAILLTPRTEWPVIEKEITATADLYRNYIVVLAAIPAVFGFLKGSLIGIQVPLMGTVRIGVGAGLVAMFVQYALSLVQVYLIALIVDNLAPTFAGQRSMPQALKLSAYAFTAAWIAALAQVLPWTGPLVGLVGVAYSIYLFYLGLPVMMKCPPERAGVYTAVTVVVAIVLGLLIGLLVGGLTGGTGMTSPQVGSSDVQFDKNSTMGKLDAWTKQVDAASKKVEEAQKSGDAAKQSEAVGAMIGTALGSGGKVEALAPDRLKPFVPNSLGGLPRTSISVERNAAMGMQIAEAKARFASNDGPSLDLQITDTGSAKGLMALAQWAAPEGEKETATGYSKTYKDGDRIVTEEWDNGGRGEYAVIVGGRFTVKVSGDAKSIDDLKRAANEIDLSGLEDLKDVGVASTN
jgi:hypothetical protein